MSGRAKVFARNKGPKEMAKKVDLSKHTLAELKTLQADVEKALKDFESQAKTKALKEMQAVAKKHGLSMEEIVGRKGKKTKAKAAPKYRNPANADETWSGRGRQPVWYKEAVAKGKKPESMAI
ncbi:MAG: H-NS histone family protein [Silicimonas sp.]|nr:H-NS histone family protein [Silicimonas sp.]